jgi:hypothetical protein
MKPSIAIVCESCDGECEPGGFFFRMVSHDGRNTLMCWVCFRRVQAMLPKDEDV